MEIVGLVKRKIMRLLNNLNVAHSYSDHTNPHTEVDRVFTALLLNVVKNTNDSFSEDDASLPTT